MPVRAKIAVDSNFNILRRSNVPTTHSGNRKAEEIITLESKRLAVQLVQCEIYSEI
jgi:hypothetical protein